MILSMLRSKMTKYPSDMAPSDITDALMAAEARHVVGLFLDALFRFDAIPDVPRLVSDLQTAAEVSEMLAAGNMVITLDGRAKLSHAALRDIAMSAESSYVIAMRYGVAASTVRAVRQRDRRR